MKFASNRLGVRAGLLAVAAALACAPVARAGMDFPDSPGVVWSNATTKVTPENDVKFHGEFSNEAVTASLENLPAHEFLQVSAKVLILRSWDGVARTNGGPRMGPDFFRMGLDDGRTLVHACFSNTPVMSGFVPTSNFQTYPSPVPGDRVPYMTGSDYKNSFGYNFPKEGNQPPITVHQDAVYSMKMIVPHTAAKVSLNFRGMGLQEIADESWGVMGVRIVPMTKGQVAAAMADQKDVYETPVGVGGTEDKFLAAPTYSRLLQVAAGKDPVAANEAFWRLVAANEGAVGYLAENVNPVGVEVAKVQELAAAVYKDAAPDDETDPRIQALIKLGVTADPVLRDLRVEAKESPTRLDWALMEVNMMPVEDADLRRWIVATRVLEAIGTAEARKARAALFPAVVR